MRPTRIALAAILLLGACDDMSDQPRQKQYAPAVGPAQRAPGVVEYRSQPTPAPPVTLALLHHGQEQFRIYCTPCHSELGDGNGMIPQRGFPHPPSYHIARLMQAPNEHFYDVITHGFGIMYPFGDRIAPSDRWAIIAYIRALQLSQDVPAKDLTPDQRKKLQ